MLVKPEEQTACTQHHRPSPTTTVTVGCKSTEEERERDGLSEGLAAPRVIPGHRGADYCVCEFVEPEWRWTGKG